MSGVEGEGVKLLRQLLFEVAELKLRLANVVQVGTIAARDAQKGYRVDLGVDEDGNQRLSPWVAHPEQAGDTATWMPMRIGQPVTLLAPSGDLAAEPMLVRGGYGGGLGAPSNDLDEVVLLKHGTVRVSAKADRLVFAVGDAKFEMTAEHILAMAETVKAEGAHLMHNAKSVGDTHGHVTAPPGPPGPPV